jgi:adenylate/nucleoside-diphosphate kinase
LKQSVENGTDLGNQVDALLNRGECVPDEMVAQAVLDKIASEEISHHGYILDDLPCRSDTWMTVDEQLTTIKNLPLKPDFVINLRIQDADLKKRWLGIKVDPITGDVFTEEQYSLAKQEEGEEDDDNGEVSEDEGEEEGSEEAKQSVGEPNDVDPLPVVYPPKEVCDRCTVCISDMEASVDRELQWYHENVLRKVEDFMAGWDRQRLIELDANQPQEELYKQLLFKLRSDGFHPVYVPLPLFDAEAEDEEDDEDGDVDEMLHHLANAHNLGHGCRWRQSRWKHYCPVELRAGNLVKGKNRFSVSFLDKIYCMSSGVALQKFMCCPRLYLLPPQPLPPCKIAVCGPPIAGKTTISKVLADHYHAKVLDPDELVKPLWNVARAEQLSKARAEAVHNAIQTVTAAEAAKTAQVQEEGGLGEEGESSGVSLPDISEDHPEVLALVQKQMTEAEKVDVQVTDAMLVEAIKQGINEVEKEHQERGTSPLYVHYH